MFIILFAIEVRRVQLKSVNILKISAKHFISSHLMLSVLFNKDRIRLFVSNRHTRNDEDTGPVTKGQIHIIRSLQIGTDSDSYNKRTEVGRHGNTE